MVFENDKFVEEQTQTPNQEVETANKEIIVYRSSNSSLRRYIMPSVGVLLAGALALGIYSNREDLKKVPNLVVNELSVYDLKEIQPYREKVDGILKRETKLRDDTDKNTQGVNNNGNAINELNNKTENFEGEMFKLREDLSNFEGNVTSLSKLVSSNNSKLEKILLEDSDVLEGDFLKMRIGNNPLYQTFYNDGVVYFSENQVEKAQDFYKRQNLEKELNTNERFSLYVPKDEKLIGTIATIVDNKTDLAYHIGDDKNSASAHSIISVEEYLIKSLKYHKEHNEFYSSSDIDNMKTLMEKSGIEQSNPTLYEEFNKYLVKSHVPQKLRQ